MADNTKPRRVVTGKTASREPVELHDQLDHALTEWRRVRRRSVTSRPSRSRGRSRDWWR
jgi:hypothetical protein